MIDTRNSYPAGFRRLAAASAFAGLFAFALTNTIGPAALNEIKRHFHKTDAQVGWIFPLSMLGFFACVLVAGRYSDKRGKLPVLLTGCALMAVGSYAFSASASFPIALAAMLVMGLGGGLTEAIAMGVVAEVFSSDRRTAMMNFAQVFFAVGAVLGPMGLAWLIRAHIDWRLAYVVIAVCCLLSAVLAAGAASMKQEKKPAAEQAGDWRTLLKDPLLMALAFGIFLYVSSESGQGSWLAPYFKDTLGAGAAISAATVALFWSGIGLGRMTATWLSAHLSDYALICVSLALALICEVVLLLTRNPVVGAAVLPLLGFGLAPVWPTIVSRATGLHPDQTGTLLGIVVAAGGLAAGVIPPLIGQIADLVGLGGALWVCPTMITANLIMFLWFYRRSKKPVKC